MNWSFIEFLQHGGEPIPCKLDVLGHGLAVDIERAKVQPEFIGPMLLQLQELLVGEIRQV